MRKTTGKRQTYLPGSFDDMRLGTMKDATYNIIKATLDGNKKRPDDPAGRESGIMWIGTGSDDPAARTGAIEVVKMNPGAKERMQSQISPLAAT